MHPLSLGIWLIFLLLNAWPSPVLTLQKESTFPDWETKRSYSERSSARLFLLHISPALLEVTLTPDDFRSVFQKAQSLISVFFKQNTPISLFQVKLLFFSTSFLFPSSHLSSPFSSSRSVLLCFFLLLLPVYSLKHFKVFTDMGS